MKRIFCIMAMLVAVASAFSQTVSKDVQYSDNSRIIEMVGIPFASNYEIALHCTSTSGVPSWSIVIDAPVDAEDIDRISFNGSVYQVSLSKTGNLFMTDKTRFAVVHGTSVPYQEHIKYKRSVYAISNSDIIAIQNGTYDILYYSNGVLHMSSTQDCKRIGRYIEKCYNTLKNILMYNIDTIFNIWCQKT